MSKINTYKKHSKCPTCTQWVTEEVEIESLPKSVDVLCVPDDNEDCTWSITIVDHRLDSISDFTATDMKDVRWFVENVAIKLHRPDHRFSVVFPTSRFDRCSRISKIEWNDWADDNLKIRKNRIDWYQKLVDKASSGAVRGSNITNRLGYNKDIE